LTRWVFPVLAVIHLLAGGASLASGGQSRVVVLIAGSCSVRDFTSAGTAELSALFERGSAGLLNVRAGRPSRELEPGSRSGFEAGCLSLGASAMATGGAEVRRAGDAEGVIDGVRVKDIFVFRTGVDPGRGRVLHPEIALMRRANDAASYRAKPGALGSALRRAGIRTAVMGCSDIPGEIHREAVAAAMDEQGLVDYGQVDGAKLLQRDPRAPYGVRTNVAALLKSYDELPDDCRLVVIDFGDTFRSDCYSEFCTDEQAGVLRTAADARLSAFAGQLDGRLDRRKDLLIILSPNPRSYSEIEGERMGAILIAGPGFGRGMLTSPSTRRPGVVTLGDVAPTVLRFFGINPGPDMVGRAMRRIAGGSAAAALAAMNAEASAQAQRQAIMRGASIAQSVIVVLVLAAIVLTRLPAVRRLAGWLVPSFAAIPISMLVMPMICCAGVVGSTVTLVALTVGILAACALVLRSPGRALGWLCWVIAIGLMVDLLRGAPLMHASIAGYNVVEGARYYGIGNELMGTMLGAAIVGAGLALGRARAGTRSSVLGAFAAPLLLCAALVFIGAPWLGANVGGALAAVPAIAIMFPAMSGRRASARGISVVLALMVIVVAGLFVIDAARGGAGQSHAGKTVEMLTSGDAGGLLPVIQRKLALNSMLVVTSVWSRLLGLCLAGSAILVWWGRREVGARLASREESAAALGCFVGTVGAFVFNDSGVVAGASCSVFLFALLAVGLLDVRPVKS